MRAHHGRSRLVPCRLQIIDIVKEIYLAMGSAVSQILDHLKDDGGLQGKDIANIVAVSPATVSRWLSGKATPDLRTQTFIAELRYVVDRLADFYSPEETRLWLHAHHPLRGNARD